MFRADPLADQLAVVTGPGTVIHVAAPRSSSPTTAKSRAPKNGTNGLAR